MCFYLIGDIGGTNSNIAIVKEGANNDSFIFKKKYKTSDYNSLSDLILKVLSQSEINNISKALFAIAGSIKNEIKLTNSDIKIDKKNIFSTTNIDDVIFLNDFVAMSYGIEKLNSNKLIEFKKGVIKKKETKCLIGAGTGLGQSMLYYDKINKNYIPKPSEFGHIDFFIEDKDDISLQNFIKKKYNKDKCEIEDVVSGRGIENIYEFLTNKKLDAKSISLNKYSDKFAKKSFDMFYKYYARAIREFSVITLPLGGIYLAGGIIQKNLDFDKEKFLDEFSNNDNFKDLLEGIPIYIVKDYDVTLVGLSNYLNLEKIFN